MGDVLLSASLQLPSPSVLTGNYRPQTAAAYVEQALTEAKARAAGSRLPTPSSPSQTARGSREEVTALRSMASRHLGALRQAPPSPYHYQQHQQHQQVTHQQSLPQRCVSTPPLRTPTRATTPLASQPQLLSVQPSQPAALGNAVSEVLTVSGAAGAGAGAGSLTTREPAASVSAGGGGGGGPAAPHSRASGVLLGRPLPMALSVPEPLSSGGGGSCGGGGGGGPGAAAASSPSGAMTAGAAAALPPEPVLGSPNGSSAHPLLCAGHHLQHLSLASPIAQHAQLASALPRLVLSLDDAAATVPPAGPAGPAAPTPPPVAAASPRVRSASHQVLSPSPHPALGGASSTLHSPPVRFASLAIPNATSRPTTALSIQDLSLPKPTAGRAGAAARSPTRGGAAWGGGVGGGGPQVLDCSRSGSGGGGGKPGTPLLQPNGRPGTSALAVHWSTGSAGEAGGRPPGTPGGGAAALDATGTSAVSGTSNGGSSAGASVVSSPGRSGGSRFQHTATRWAADAAGAAGGEGGRVNDTFKITRGMLYSVFQELDEFDSGRLTYSAFEQAACKVGMRPAQAKRLFDQLDPQSRGFTTMREWISGPLQRQMEAFTRLYVLATRDRDGKPKDFTEIRSMHMAIQMAMVKLQLKRCGRAVSLERLVQAFSYMDRDNNGALNSEEVEDALNSLGIFVTKDVISTIMRTFDKDGSGGVDYYEFVKSLYPTLDHIVYHA